MRTDLTAEEVAALAGIKRESVLTARSRGTSALPARGSGRDRRRIYFREDDVSAWLEERRKARQRRRRCATRDSVIAAAARAGALYADIASVHGVSVSDVSRIARKAGHRDRPHRSGDLRRAALAYAREHGFDMAAAHFGVCRRSLFIWAAKEAAAGAP